MSWERYLVKTFDEIKKALRVVVVGPVEMGANQQSENFYAEILNVASGDTVELLNYTALQDEVINNVILTGKNIAQYVIEIDGDKQAQVITNYASLTISLPLKKRLNSGVAMVVRVHNFRPTIADFYIAVQKEIIP